MGKQVASRVMRAMTASTDREDMVMFVCFANGRLTGKTSTKCDVVLKQQHDLHRSFIILKKAEAATEASTESAIML